MNTNLNKLALAAAVAAIAIPGCTPEARSDYDAAGDKAGQAAQKTGEAIATDADKTGEAIEQGAENAAEAIDDATDKAQQAAKAGEMTLKVKNAILTAENLEAKDLNVDTVGKVIHLKGSVPTAEAKARAGKIAETQAGGEFTVSNELTVAPGK